MAVSEYDKQYLSQENQNKIASLTQQAQAGTISWADAHNQAENIRASAGYTGGAMGNEYNPGGYGSNTTSYTPKAATSYQTTGTNYHQDAINAAQAGDWGAVNQALNQREAKTAATGQNYGKTSADIYAELWNQYGNNGTTTPDTAAEYLKDMYAQNTAAELAALKSAYDQNVLGLKANAEKIPVSYQAARNEAAAQSEIDRRNWAEYANARGLNTGTSGQAELARQSTLSGNLAGISTAEQDALAANDLQLQQLAIEYQNAVNQAQATGNTALAQALYQEYVRQEEAALAQRQYDQEQANWERSFAQEQANFQAQLDMQNQQLSTDAQNLNREYAYNIAMGVIQSGKMPDSGTLATAGISTTDAQTLAAYYQGLLAAQAAKATSSGKSSSGGGSGGSSGSSSSGGPNWSAVENWVSKYGEDAAENYIAEHYKDLGYSSKPAAIAGWNNHLLETGGISGSGDSGMNEANFGAAARSIASALAQGRADSITEYVGQMWDKLSAAQKNSISDLYARYGYEISA